MPAMATMRHEYPIIGKKSRSGAQISLGKASVWS